MDIDEDIKRIKKLNVKVSGHRNQVVLKPLFFQIAIGIFAIITSFLAIFVATFLGVTNMSLINASMILILTILLLLFLFIQTMNHAFNDRGDLFLIGLIVLIIDLVVFILKLLEFVSIPLALII